MVVQEITYLIEDKNQPIIIESLSSGETIEAYAHLLSRSLATVEKLSGDNIKITVNDRAFEGLKRFMGQ